MRGHWFHPRSTCGDWEARAGGRATHKWKLDGIQDHSRSTLAPGYYSVFVPRKNSSNKGGYDNCSIKQVLPFPSPSHSLPFPFPR